MALDLQSSGGPHRVPQVSGGRAVESAARPSAVSKRSGWKRRPAQFGLALLLLLALVGAGAGWLVQDVARHLPAITGLTVPHLNRATTIVSSDGVLLATLRTRLQRPVTLDAISPHLIDATLAIEDSRFYEHHGVDSRGVLRALWSNLRVGNARGQGGSTLTQQLARSLYLSNDKTFRRKIAEMLLARRIEDRYSKHDILEAYLNTVYYGSGNYGAEAAARSYFGKSACDLSLGEAALLAGLPQRPAALAPTAHLQAALTRRREVLARLLAAGQITDAQRTQAETTQLHILRPQLESIADWKAPYAIADVIAWLRAKYGPEFIYSGVTIETTLNWQMQQAAEQILRAAVRHGSEGGANPNTGALVSIEPRSGAIRALVGGPNFQRDQFDAATRGIRQPGSAFKPLVYLTAFDTDICNLITTYKDAPTTYPDSGKDYVVHNYDHKYHGQVSVLDAIRHSLNTVAVKVGEDAGLANVVTYAQKLGIRTPLDPGLSLALGASGVHPLDLCSAYSAFANGGERYEPVLIARITDAGGKATWTDDPTLRRVPNFLKPRSLDEINVALREVVTDGTARAADAIPDARGKTGTTNSHRDAWFVGYTGDLATAVWVARVHKETKTEVVNGRPVRTSVNTYQPMEGATGGHLCAPLWTRFMQAALPIQQRVDAARGLAPITLAAPTTQTLVATLQTEARKARETKIDPTLSALADGKPTPPDFQPAQNGSGPIIVTAPDDTQEKVEETPETTGDTGNTGRDGEPPGN